MRILIVSDVHPYSTFDVYKGYCDGFESLKVPYETVNLPLLLEANSMERAMTLVVAKMLIKENAFTHVLFVAGTMIPRWVLESKYDKKIGMIATDDPHSSKMLLDNYDLLDYYFTNEKTLEVLGKNNIVYLPTAVSEASVGRSKVSRSPHYQSDVCFIGSIYPNRVKPLETVCRWAENNGKKLKIIGPVDAGALWGETFVPKDSIIMKYAQNGVVDNKETLMYYANSKCVINMDRDVKWSPCYKEENPHLINRDISPYSMNPRCYETSICKVPQLYIDPRKEAIDIFGDDIWYGSTDDPASIATSLDKIFGTRKKMINNKVTSAYKKVVKNHLYTHRAAKIISTFIKL